MDLYLPFSGGYFNNTIFSLGCDVAIFTLTSQSFVGNVQLSDISVCFGSLPPRQPTLKTPHVRDHPIHS